MNSEERRNENDVQEPNGKRRKTSQHSEETNDVEDRNETAIVVENGSSLLNDKYLFNAVMSWLNTADVSRCCQVCKGWNNQITQQTWTRAAKNKSKVGYEVLFDALQKRNGSCCLDAKAMAIGLSRLPPRRYPTAKIPKPTLKPSDVFLHLELSTNVSNRIYCRTAQSSKKKFEFSWCQSLQECCGGFGDGLFASVVFLDAIARNGSGISSSSSDNKIDEPIKIDGFEHRPVVDCYYDRSSLHIDPNVFGEGIDVLFSNARITLRLFRADTGKSVLLTHEKRVDGCMAHRCYFLSNEMKPMASTLEGIAAKEMCSSQRYNYLQVVTDVRVYPILPEVGLPDEPDWVQSMRGRGRYQFSSTNDYDDFLKTKFEYQFVSIKSAFQFSVGNDDRPKHNVDSLDHFMRFLEGLAWE